MWFPRRLRSMTASCLVALLGALGTGLPSHHHDDGRVSSDRTTTLHAADHHSHGTQLVEQDRRAPSATVEFVAPRAVSMEVGTVTVATVHPARSIAFRPTERAPPTVSPRAPPFPA